MSGVRCTKRAKAKARPDRRISSISSRDSHQRWCGGSQSAVSAQSTEQAAPQTTQAPRRLRRRDTAENEGRRTSSKAAGIGGCYRVLVCGNSYQQWWASQPAVSRLLELPPVANRPWAPARGDTQQRQLSSRAPPNGQHQLAYPRRCQTFGRIFLSVGGAGSAGSGTVFGIERRT